MAALAPVLAEKTPDAVQRIAGLLQGFSLEATRPTDADIAALRGLRPGTRIYISAVPGRAAEEITVAATRLRAAGFEPVPHVAVRNFQSTGALDEFLARLNGEANVQRVLVIAGDREACGPFRSAIDAIDSGVFRRRGIRTLGIAGYPQGHARISDDQLIRALSEKIAAAEATGIEIEIVTQFCFDSPAILDYVEKLRRLGRRSTDPHWAHRSRQHRNASTLCQPMRRAGLGTDPGTKNRSDPRSVCPGCARPNHPNARRRRTPRYRHPFLFLRRITGHRPLGPRGRRWPYLAGPTARI